MVEYTSESSEYLPYVWACRCPVLLIPPLSFKLFNEAKASQRTSILSPFLAVSQPQVFFCHSWPSLLLFTTLFHKCLLLSAPPFIRPTNCPRPLRLSHHLGLSFIKYVHVHVTTLGLLHLKTIIIYTSEAVAPKGKLLNVYLSTKGI
jgi:hypothetical protein